MSEEKQATSPEPEATETTVIKDEAVASVVEAIEQKAAADLAVATDTVGTTVTTDETTSDDKDTATQQIFKDLVNKLKELWQKLTSAEQKPRITSVVIVVVSVLALIITSKLLEVVNSLPLLPPFLELVGIGYSIWFIQRYLFLAETRQELVDNVKGIKSKILG
ncbi:hypothetical protein Pse7367_0467 [Thalassoporum mexicanum PCC 7367]|uniref:CAAD domain-containing protein n=1 Tax=Thalassoporum mexicanum TaxID=3457544 RepID=UPI00029FF7CC|nr:CAAD domain-containing protein [Pseudanabaena sp. PCC 7367]AFY68777.1 hypothetical protein Pse7367_0467 [Pseudanabaena sp. PCC 7367]